MSAYELLIGTRYLRSAHRRGFVSFVAAMSVCGLMLGVATLVVVLSVMNGFERELRTRILAVTSHATISGLNGSLADWRALQAKVRQQQGVLAAVPYIESQAMFAHGTRMVGANVRGVLPAQERTATGLAQRITAGSLEALTAGGYGTILGNALAHELNARLGDTVVLIAPQGTATPTGVVPRMRRFKVVGLFTSGMYEFDRGLALVQMDDAARLFRTRRRRHRAAPGVRRSAACARDGAAGGARARWPGLLRQRLDRRPCQFLPLHRDHQVDAVHDPAHAGRSGGLQHRRDAGHDREGEADRHRHPAHARRHAAQRAAHLCRAGRADRTCRHAARAQRSAPCVSDNLETLVGALERLLGTQFLDARVYYMSDLPAYVEGGDVLKICAVAFLLCVLATIYPAWRASRTAPAEALRHE